MNRDVDRRSYKSKRHIWQQKKKRDLKKKQNDYIRISDAAMQKPRLAINNNIELGSRVLSMVRTEDQPTWIQSTARP